MRKLFFFIFISIACLYGLTGHTENLDPRERNELSVTKRRICNYLSNAEFENIVDKPCIVYKSGDYGLVLWAIIYQDGDSLGIYYTPYEEKKRKFRSKNKNSFDTTVFLDKYASIFKWGMDSLPESISKERLEERKFILCLNMTLHVFSKDQVSPILLPEAYEYEHEEIKVKVQKIVFLLMGLCWPDDRKTLPIPNDDLGITLPLDKW